MAICNVCNNEYEHSLEIIYQNKAYYFDCFECAIHRLAPICAHCGCKMIGHGVEDCLQVYCCKHCASQAQRDVKQHDV